MTIADISVAPEQDRIIRIDGLILDTADYWTVRWTEVRAGYVDEDWRADFVDELEAREFAEGLA